MYNKRSKRRKKRRAKSKRSMTIEANAVKVGESFSICAAVEDWGTVEAAAATDGNQPKLRNFSMTAYTGGAMRLRMFFDPVVVDLAGLSISSKPRPIFRDHSPEKIVGHTEKIIKTQSTLKVSGIISGTSKDAQEVVDTSLNGFPWQASIGTSVEQVEFIRSGSEARANGRVFRGPVNIVRKATLGEVSFVALGADDKTSAKIAAESHHHTLKDEDSTMNFQEWLKAQGFNSDDLTEDQRTSLQAMFDRQQSDTDPEDKKDPVKKVEAKEAVIEKVDNDYDVVARIRQESAEEAQRVADIRKICAGKKTEIEVQAIREGWDVTKTELAVIKASRPVIGAPAIGRGMEPVTDDILEAAACMAGGITKPENYYKEQTLEAADKRFSCGIGLQELILEAAWANGYDGRSFRSDMSGVLHAAFSTLSLPGILSNVANKFMLAGFNAIESTWRSIAATRPVKDFKQITSYRLTGDFKYEKIGPDGEIKHGDVGEESLTNKADTYGKMFAITRKDLINDDLGILTQIPFRIGRGGHLKFNEVFWTKFLNNSSFFVAGNNNYKAGATTALGVDSLTTAEKMFLDQIDAKENPIGILPSVLLVPNALNATASVLMKSADVRISGSSNRKEPTTNPHAGKFSVQRSSYLSNAKISGSSALAWYLIANPNDMPVIEAVFLNGKQVPTVESADADFNTLGIQMRGFHDFGVELQEFRGGVKMKGEA